MLQYLPAAIQLGTSLYQMYQGNKLGKTEDPGFQIPQEVQQALNSSKTQAAMKEFAGQSRIEDKLRGSTAATINAVNQMGGGAAGMGAALQAYGNEQSKLGDLAIQAEQDYNRRQKDYQSMLLNMAGWQNQKNDWERQKYLSAQQQASDLKGAAMSNLMGAAQGGIGSYFNKQAFDEQKRLSQEYLNLAKNRYASGNTNNTQPLTTQVPFTNGSNGAVQSGSLFPNSISTNAQSGANLLAPNSLGGGISNNSTNPNNALQYLYSLINK